VRRDLDVRGGLLPVWGERLLTKNFRFPGPDTVQPGNPACGLMATRFIMYAVLRTGGKQYRVSPGDTLRIEKTEHQDGSLEFSDILAVSGDAGKFEEKLEGAKILASVVGEGRGEKILVFHYKRKKQYKKLQGHRQDFVTVKINEIQVNGQSFKAEAAK
jgi:large subunit ribosomal protein L21